MEERRGIKLVRVGVGKLLLVVAGCGALVLVIFVLMPMLTPTQAPQPPPMAPQEIVQEVLGGTVAEAPEEGLGEALPAAEGMAEDAAEPVPDPGPSPGQARLRGQSVMEVPSPRPAVGDDGEALPVVFPRQGPGTAEDLAEVDEVEAVGDGLPRPLSPEEIAAALPEPAQSTEPARTVDSPAGAEMPESVAPEAAVQVAAADDESLQARAAGPSAEAPALTVVERPVGATPAEVREVQALLKELGYDPGPLDGVWGSRTTEAWKTFARQAGGLALALAVASVGELSGDLMSPQELEELKELEAHWVAEQASASSESRSPSEAASPSEAPSPAMASGAGQAGTHRRQAGLPPQPAVVPGTLRGVMGYRMPLVSRQEVPDQVVSGVLIPAHTTFVILKPGYWELVGLDPGDVEYLRDAAARAEAEALAVKPEPDPQPVRRGWNPLRLFRRQPQPGQQ